jgi:dipeptidyl aminopeptidase/acylaminoacyl peptidase
VNSLSARPLSNRAPFALVALVSLALAAPAQASFPGQNGNIASADREQGDIYLYGGAGVRRLTRDGSSSRRGGNSEPQFSADGRLIAFTHQNAVWAMGADGSGKRQLTFDPLRAHSPSWSRDGRQIAFIGELADISGLFVMNADGSEPLFIDGERQSTGAAWSPDGSLIAAVSYTVSGTSSGDHGIDLVTPDGSARRRLVSGQEWEGVEWAPDGARLALTRHVPGGDGDDSEIWVVNADGSGLRRLRAHGRGAVWSPDNRVIAFTATASCTQRTGEDGEESRACHRVMNADGSRVRRLPLDSPPDDWQSCFAACRPPILDPSRVVVTPSLVRLGPTGFGRRLVLFRFRATVAENGRRRPLSGATIVLSTLDESSLRRGGPARGPNGLPPGPRARTNRLGRTTIRHRPEQAGRFRVEVWKKGFLTGVAFVRLR